MSGQPPQRVRRNVSPTIQTQRPMKAVLQFSLKSSPSKSPASSPTAIGILSRRSPDYRHSPERKSPISPSFKVERPKPVRVTNTSPSTSTLRRTGSLEAIYLKGQWPAPEILSTSHFMVDKSTQTPEDWPERQKVSRKKKKSHRRSASFGHGDQLAEIEKLVLEPSGTDNEDIFERAHDIPDGHRAPIPEVIHRGSSTRNVDTQTPSGCLDDTRVPSSCQDESSGSRSSSVSPAIPIIPGQMDSSRPSSRADSSGSTPREGDKLGKVDGEGCESPDSQFKVVSSPRPNKSYSFVREPPDGCEKVKVIDEDAKSRPAIKEQLLYCPIKPSQMVFKRSDDSAFCPLFIKSQGKTTFSQSTSPIEQIP
ncbi:hypothetical protein KUTeg_008916 [Tegillarca granosa]|uniref:Glucocorticoid-induced transcript 1 protein n=1 Tax=Tegillarca granosa TaxID=220873 RepID=A0ABQ9FFA5_TEGGR|nr:hypothetical protein KUTeg_008916 [Tegillarca granosa]